ncbi:hypothetical protein NF556_00920 [Ornithinimicrobium faecis]|uniref:Aminoglycoside phosphotransferase domain-containing protein n=1 Tax=Ornithinimicrobium faecis TaxID=2934158 RepID=A0ABY4YUF8_9MICO|nr:phosphotransferase [Ornithinimicrobium sp. HY1793]USQ80256.1 hypothetical protein NF556_00920 [Ornithinimicrobium sp. HY1793]
MQTQSVAPPLGQRARGVLRRGLTPLVRRIRRGSSATKQRSGQDPVLQRQGDRVSAALSALEQLEAAEPALPNTARPTEFLALDRAIRRPEIADHLHTMLPAPLRGDWDEHEESVHRLSAPIAADVVVLAKFDLSEQVKFRAAYGAARCSVAVQPDRPNGASGVLAAVRSHEIVTRYAPGLIPPMLGHGDAGGGQRYLVERWVDGTPLITSEQMAAHLAAILEGMGQVHRGYGIHTARLSALWGRFAAQWQAVREAGLVPGDVADRVAELIADDHRLRVSWSHGDLVASNVMATDAGVTIIDWEHATERPIMHDAAKLHQFTADKEPLLDLLLAEWGRKTATGGYRPAEELALLHARFLCRAPSRMAELAGHQRSGLYARQVTRQVDLLAQTLAR